MVDEDKMGEKIGFERNLEFDEIDGQLSIRNEGRVNRQLATHDKLGRTSYSAYVRHIQYGTYGKKPACLLAIDFSFRFPTRSNSRFSSAYIEVTFEKALDISKPRLRSTDASLDPIVANFAPKQLSDEPKVREVSRMFEVEIPFKIEAPFVSAGFSLKRSSEIVQTEEGRGQIHGTLFQDDEHDDGPNGVAWDLEENHVSKEGIVRSLRALVVLHCRPREAFWMHVEVKPVVNFTLDPRRLVRRLVGDRDEPIALDGRTEFGKPECFVQSDFDYEDFPWQILLAS
ncbi:hypothetical protein GGR51DRAFT_536556 [Nemania sp. FL0031]|nr:hypothetical protein GGR51DRAFT_536556 [Nemania sp. FL0031]